MAGRNKRRVRTPVPEESPGPICPGCGARARTPHPVCMRKRAEALYDQALRKTLTEYATPIDITPEAALLALVREAAGNVAWLGARIQQLVEDSPRRGEPSPSTSLALQGTVTRTTGLGSAGGYDQGDRLFGPRIDIDRNGIEHIVGEEYRAMVLLYNEERDRLRLTAKDAIAAGILQSQVDLAEYQAQAMVSILNRVLDRMDIEGVKQDLARKLLAEEFREQAKEAVPK